MIRFAAILALAASLHAEPQTYTIDASHATAQFSVRHLMVSNVKGTFGKFSGTATWDPANLGAAKLEATIDVASVNTNQIKRDEHLRSADFFDIAKFPSMTFKSARFQKSGSQLKMTGQLTIKGITKEVTFDIDGPTDEIKDPRGLFRRGASATATINRKDFGLTYNALMEAGGAVVGDEVKILLEAELVRK
ncbi:MAG: polyisoprenoid-binding protein [Bryobacterales bacterium]|nr:polyisoprenoid-binding protein [Bryobacterales bacterium]